MFDGFWSGIFGGLFGPALAQWMSRFKYWVVFLAIALSWQFVFFIMAIYYNGWADLINIFIHDSSTFLIIFIYSPLGFGVLGVFIAFLGSLNTPKKPSEDDQNNP
jgi:hypothetical protein